MEVPAKFRSVWADFRYLLLALIFIVTAALLTSCGSGGTTITIGGTGSGDTSFELTYLQNVTTNGTTSISTYVTQSDVLPDGSTSRKAVQNVTVNFQIVENNSSSFLDAESAVTGSDGRASVTYTAGSIDSVTDRVMVEISGIVPQYAAITVNPPGIGTISVSVTATPNVLEAVTDPGADNQATIAATVSSSAGIMVGEDVTFTTNAGTLCDYPNCTGAATITQTDANGVARIILQSSTNLETAVVEARIGTVSGSTTVTFIAGAAAGFELFASPSNLTADGDSTSTITAVVSDSEGHLVADGATVNFSIKNTSTGTGNFVEIPPSDQTAGGVATVNFRAGTTPGAIDIRASSGGVDSDDIDPAYGNGLITLISEFIGSVNVVVNPTILTADGASIAQVTATVLNPGGTPVNPGTPVTVTTTGGDLDTDFNFSNPRTSVTTTTVGNSGVASLFLRSSTTSGQYFVAANSGGRTDSVQINFIAGLADAAQSELTVAPNSIPADGSSTAILTLTAKDAIGNPVADGKTVIFSTNRGVISNATTTTAGVATATLTSSNTPGDVNLSANIDTIVETATMTFGTSTSANPNSIDLVLSATTLTVESPTGSDTIQIQATVLDASGNPIGVDCPNNITFRRVAGPSDVTLDGSSADVTKTTSSGVAPVTLKSGTTPGTVRVQVTASQDTGNCSSGTPTTVSVTTTAIVITSGPAANILISQSPNVVDNQDGTISRGINALLSDKYGNPVENDTAVLFTLDATGQLYGTICGSAVTGNPEQDSTCSLTTGSGTKGYAHSMLTWISEGIYAPFIVTAESETQDPLDPTQTVIIFATYENNFSAVKPVAIDVTINPISVTGGSGVSVVAEYHDGAAFPNPISGVDLAFSSSSPLATVDTSPVTTDINGFAVTTVTTTAACLASDTSVTITAADLPYSSGSAQMTIQKSRPTASFTVTNNGGGTFSFTNTSDEPTAPGFSYSYLWNFGDSAAGSSTQANPTYTYAAAESGNTLTVTLTVTNDGVPVSCSNAATNSVTVP